MCRYRPFILRMLPSALALQGVRRRLRNTTGRTGPSTACGLPRDAAVCVLPCFSVGCSSRVSTPPDPGSRSAVGTVIGMAQPSVGEASPGGLDCVLQRPGCNLRHRCKWVGVRRSLSVARAEAPWHGRAYICTRSCSPYMERAKGVVVSVHSSIHALSQCEYE